MSEILKHTGTSFLMQPAVGPAKHMTGILMGAEMQDSHGNPCVLVVPDVSVYDQAMSDILIPVGHLIQAGFMVNHRIPSQANEDGFSLTAFLLYGGTIPTPDDKTIIVMEYAQYTWRLPLSSNKRISKPKLPPHATSENFVNSCSTASSFIDLSNSFHTLDEIDDVDDEGYVPTYLSQDRIERRFQQRYDLMLKQPEMAGIYHTCHGHCNNRQTVLNLQAKGILYNHLKRYILAHRCDSCHAAPGRRHHKIKAIKKANRKTKSISKTVALVAPAITTAFDSQNPLTECLDLEFSTITDAIDLAVAITESLACLFEHTSNNPSDYPDISQIRNMSGNANDLANSGIGQGATTSANATTPLFSPPGTDLRVDWEDACGLGCFSDLNRNFLLVMDKGTEYFGSFPTKTRASPLALLKQCFIFIGRKIRFLQIDGAKQFQSDEIKEFCAQLRMLLTRIPWSLLMCTLIPTRH